MACAALDQPLCTVTQQISSTELGMQPARCLHTRLRGARKSSVYVAGVQEAQPNQQAVQDHRGGNRHCPLSQHDAFLLLWCRKRSAQARAI